MGKTRVFDTYNLVLRYSVAKLFISSFPPILFFFPPTAICSWCCVMVNVGDHTNENTKQLVFHFRENKSHDHNSVISKHQLLISRQHTNKLRPHFKQLTQIMFLNCQNTNSTTTQPQFNITLVGLDTKMTLHTTPPHPPPTQTQ